MTEKESTEACLFGAELLHVPHALITQAEVFNSVLSYDTWAAELSEGDRHHLQKFLPNVRCQEEQETCLRELFSGANIKFGNPLEQFRARLFKGHYEPDVSRCRTLCTKAKWTQYKQKMKHYHTQLLERLLVLQQMYFAEAHRVPEEEDLRERLRSECWRADCRRCLQPFDDLRSSDAPNKSACSKYKRILHEAREESGCHEGTSSSDEENDVHSGPDARKPRIDSADFSKEDRCMTLLQCHRKRRRHREKSPSLDTRSVSSIDDIIGRVFLDKARKTSHESVSITLQHNSSTSLQSLSPVTATPAATLTKKRKKLKKRVINKLANVDEDDMLAPHDKLSVGGANVLYGMQPSEDWELEANPLEPLHGRSATPLIIFHEDFFALLGHIIQSFPSSKTTTQKIEERVREWQEAVLIRVGGGGISPLTALRGSSWYNDEDEGTTNWVELVQPALKYLAGDVASSVAFEGNFVPLVDYKERAQLWKWLGGGGSLGCGHLLASGSSGLVDDDGDADGSNGDADAYRRALWAHWLENKDGIVASMKGGGSGGGPPEPTPPARVNTTYVVRPSTEAEKVAFQKQEVQRFANPRHSFTYNINGYDAVVGPVKGVYEKATGGSGNKAREHALLVSERPSFVTILTLVRDAAARLPNGEGTRSDICELLKDSQFLAEGVTEGQINTVVSGALDRLHYEKDPCVKYDGNRKLWIYLHRSRSEDEFKRIHEVQGAVVKAKKAHTKPRLAMAGTTPKRSRTSASTAFSSADAMESADDVATAADDFDEPAMSPLGLPPVDSPSPLPIRTTMPTVGDGDSIGISSVTASSTAMPAIHKGATPTSVPCQVAHRHSLINRLVVTSPQQAPAVPLPSSKVAVPLSHMPLLASTSLAIGAGTASRQVPQQQQASATLAGAVVTAARSQAPLPVAAAQQHYTFSLVTSAPNSSGTGSAMPARSVVASSPMATGNRALSMAATTAELAASNMIAGAATRPGSIVIQQQSLRRPQQHVTIRQQLSSSSIGADLGAGMPVSVVAPPSGQIRVRLEQPPLAIMTTSSGCRPAASIMLQPAVVSGGVEKGGATTIVAISATHTKGREVAPATSAPAITAGFVGSKQVFYQKLPAMQGATVLQKIITTGQPNVKSSLVAPPAAFVHKIVGNAGGANQVLARIVQSATPASATNTTTAVGGAVNVTRGQPMISTMQVQGKTLAVPLATAPVTMIAALASSALPPASLKLAASPRITQISVAGGAGGSTLVRPSTAAALLAEKRQSLSGEAYYSVQRPAGTTQVVLASSAHQMLGANQPPRIFISTAAAPRLSVSTAAFVQKSGAAPAAGSGLITPGAGGQLVTTLYTTNSNSAMSSTSPATFILTKPLAASTAPNATSALTSQSGTAYSLSSDLTTKSKTIPVYARLISSPALASDQQLLTRPVTAAVSHPGTTILLGQPSVASNEPLIIVPMKKSTVADHGSIPSE